MKFILALYQVIILFICWVQCWAILGAMSWTLARHRKATLNKTSRCRGSVCFCNYTMVVQRCMSNGSLLLHIEGGGPRVVVSTAAFHARARGSVPGLGGLKETKIFLPHPRVKVSIVGSLRDREVACSASDRQGSNFESCVWRTVLSHSSHHPQEVLLAQSNVDPPSATLAQHYTTIGSMPRVYWGSAAKKPSKHKTLNQCWVDVGPPSTTSAQHQPNIGSMSRVRWEGVL